MSNISISRLCHEIKLLEDVVINLELIDTLKSKTIYTIQNVNDNLELILNENIKFDECKIEIKLFEDSIFYDKNINLFISFIFTKQYPFTCCDITYNNFIDTINLSKKIVNNIRKLMINESYFINENEENNKKYYIYYRLNKYIKEYRYRWISGDRLKNFVNNFLITIYDIENEIKKNDETYNEEIPSFLTDNVFTSTIFKDPVVAEDGFTYEREAIQKWFNNNKRSPTTGKILNSLVLYPNHDMRSRCIEWKEIHSIKSEL